jgi:hypothetical protein
VRRALNRIMSVIKRTIINAKRIKIVRVRVGEVRAWEATARGRQNGGAIFFSFCLVKERKGNNDR